MPRKLIPLVLAALLAPLALPQTAPAAKTSRVLVHFAKHTSTARQKALIARIGGREVATVRRLGTLVLRVPAEKKADALALLRRQSGVTYAEADGIVRATAVTVNDPLLDSSSWQLANVDLPTAWSITTGSSAITVAVVDSGVQPNHPDLGTLVPGYDFVNNDTDTSDTLGHGTAVAGIIAGQGNNGIGIAGVCWQCRIMPVKVMGATGTGTWTNIANGITWATDHGAQVINLSLGGTASSQTLASAVSYAENHGVVVVASAGNDGSSTESVYPADYPGVISVAAVDDTGARYSWSNSGSWVQVDAPGCTNTTWPGNLYASGFCGTSAAAPFVSGLAALALSYKPSATATQVAQAIESTAHADAISAHGFIDAVGALEGLGATLPPASAAFSIDRSSGYAPLTVSLTNTSQNATSYAWSFGDGTHSTVASLSHTFTTPGTYKVTLAASDGTMSALASSTVTVLAPAPVASFTASRVSGYAPLGVSFKNKSKNATSYLWSFGDSSPFSNDAAPSHTFTKPGIYTVTLTSTGPDSQAKASKTITVLKPRPDLAVSLVRTTSKRTGSQHLTSFTVTVGNRGGASDSGVKITVKLPAGASFASVSSGARRCARTLRRATCSVGALLPDATTAVSFVARVVKRAKVTVSVSGKQTETSLANNTARAKSR